MATYKFNVPYRVHIVRKTKANQVVRLNQNEIKNLHYHVYNKAKKLVKEIMRPELEGIKINTPVLVDYQVFKPSARKLDKMNVISIASKFFLDAVTECGCWPDDNDDHIKLETLLPTEIDRQNPRIEITIREIGASK